MQNVRCWEDSVAKVPKGHAANFPPKNEISDKSTEPQARCQNRPCVWRPTAWSPTLLFDHRAYGSKNLSRMPQKDFCNTIEGLNGRRDCVTRLPSLTHKRHSEAASKYPFTASSFGQYKRIIRMNSPSGAGSRLLCLSANHLVGAGQQRGGYD